MLNLLFMKVNAPQTNCFYLSRMGIKTTAFFRVQFFLASCWLQQAFEDLFPSVSFCNSLWWIFWHNSCISESHLISQTLWPCVISISRHVAENTPSSTMLLSGEKSDRIFDNQEDRRSRSQPKCYFHMHTLCSLVGHWGTWHLF